MQGQLAAVSRRAQFVLRIQERKQQRDGDRLDTRLQQLAEAERDVLLVELLADEPVRPDPAGETSDEVRRTRWWATPSRSKGVRSSAACSSSRSLKPSVVISPTLRPSARGGRSSRSWSHARAFRPRLTPPVRLGQRYSGRTSRLGRCRKGLRDSEAAVASVETRSVKVPPVSTPTVAVTAAWRFPPPSGGTLHGVTEHLLATSQLGRDRHA